MYEMTKSLQEWIEHNDMGELQKQMESAVENGSKDWAARGCMMALREHCQAYGIGEEP